MGTANSLLLISDNKEEIAQFRTKLMLLRGVDSIMESPVESAINACRKYIPDTIIIFASQKNDKLLELCKQIRQDSALKNTPIIFLVDLFDEEFILSGFDAGMSDYISMPARDSDILMRVIWCLQKSELSRDLDKKLNVLSDFGVINKETGAYTAKYAPRVFSGEIKTAHRLKYPLSLMAVAVDNIYSDKINDNLLAATISKSVRNMDILGMADNGYFYILLPKTEIKGVKAVFERIKNNAGGEFTISSGAAELSDLTPFAELSENALTALKQALASGNSLVVGEKKQEREISLNSEVAPSQEMNKNYKLFKQVFNKKLNNVITPVFVQTQAEFKEKYPENVLVAQSITENECSFSLKEPERNNEVTLNIAYQGLSKIIIDIFYTKSGEKACQTSQIDIAELNEQYLAAVLNDISLKFDSFSEQG